MKVSDIWVADSGRAINNGTAVVYASMSNSSGNYKSHFDGINNVMKPSGYGGNATQLNPYWNRFDDYGYYTESRSGNILGVPGYIGYTQ